MAKSVNDSFTEAAFQTEAEKMQEFYDALGTLASGTFSSGLDEMDSDITNAKAKMSSWAADDVQSKLQAFLDGDLTGAESSIRSDISGGGFSQLRTTAGTLVTDLNGCKTAKHDYEEAKTTYANKKTAYENTPSRIEGEWHGNSQGPSKPNPAKSTAKTAMDNAEAAMKSAKAVLDAKITTTNTDFTTIAGLTFDPTGEKNSALVGAGQEAHAAEAEVPEFVPVDDVTVAGEDVSEVAAMAAGLATPVDENVSSDVQVADNYTDAEGNVYDSKGGSDGHHYSSREDAIAVLLTAAPDKYTEETAGQLVDEYISKGLITLPPVDGMKDYTEDRHTEQLFEGKDGDRATRTEDLKIEGDAIPGQDGADPTLIPEHGEGTAHYVTTDGEEYTGDITVDFGHEGASFNKNEKITSDATGEQVAEVDTHQVMEYKDGWTGADVNVTDRNIQEGDTVKGRRDMTYGYGEGQTYNVSSEWSYKVPADGQPITEGTYVADGHTYTYARNEQGQLVEYDTYTQGKFLGIFGEEKEVTRTSVVDTSQVYTLKVTNPDGSVTTTPVLMDTQMGFAEVARQYENARIDVGYRADVSREGIHFLTMGDGGPVEVSGVWDDSSSYTFELIPPEN